MELRAEALKMMAGRRVFFSAPIFRPTREKPMLFSLFRSVLNFRINLHPPNATSRLAMHRPPHLRLAPNTHIDLTAPHYPSFKAR